ncbi:MAG: hypothetical protein SWI22_02165 [Pseudomonadota bacterium]|nr:hypothetical protein [Pseudomonadota bacterium]
MARFNGKPFAAGRKDAFKLAGHALSKMGRRAPLLTKAPYKDADGALAMIQKAGFKDVVEMMDSIMGVGPDGRIAPASARPGDIVALAAPEPFGCSLTVALDNGRVLGFDGTNRVCQPLIPHQFVAAWRS